MEKQSNPVGRPEITLNDLPLDWQDIMLQCYEQGGTDVECRQLLPTKQNPKGISVNTFYRLMEDYPDFLKTVKKGKELSYAWWIGAGRTGMNRGKDFNATTYIFMMKNMFGWDKPKEDDRNAVNYNITLKLND